MRGRLVAIAAAGAVAVATLLVVRSGIDPDRLPRAITTTDVVAEIGDTPPPGAVLEQTVANPVRAGVLQPGEPLRGAGQRASLVAPPRSHVRLRLTVPPASTLLFAVGVDGPKRREREKSGVRFGVAVDGRPAWSRDVNPAATRDDRLWFDGRAPLGDAGGPVEIDLTTDAVRPGAPLAGTAGWSRLRVVTETTHARQPARAGAPNVLVLLVDTLRADAVGCYGATPSPTPALDRLAAGGLVFEHAVSQSSWTLASVASLFTGRHPRSHGAVRGRPGDDDHAGSALPDGVLTWAEAAARAGVTTVGVSSNPLVSRATNLAQGFETFREFTWDPKGRTWTAAAEVNDAFLRWLGRNRGHRFVAWLHYMEPHDPYAPPAALRPPVPPGLPAPLVDGWVRDVANALNWKGAPPLAAPDLAYVRALYAGDVRSWDAALPALLDGLTAAGVRDDTVVIVTADHGEEFQEHGHLTHGAHLYEESIRVPLVVAGPGIPSERRRDLAQGIDLFPTVAALLGVEAPADLPGRNLLASREAPHVVSETARGIAPDGAAIDVVSIRTPDWKLIRTPALDRWELYHLAADPAERQNQWTGTGHGGLLARVLAAWETTAPRPPSGGTPDPALAEKLRALGYVE